MQPNPELLDRFKSFVFAIQSGQLLQISQCTEFAEVIHSLCEKDRQGAISLSRAICECTQQLSSNTENHTTEERKSRNRKKKAHADRAYRPPGSTHPPEDTEDEADQPGDSSPITQDDSEPLEEPIEDDVESPSGSNQTPRHDCQDAAAPINEAIPLLEASTQQIDAEQRQPGPTEFDSVIWHAARNIANLQRYPDALDQTTIKHLFRTVQESELQKIEQQRRKEACQGDHDPEAAASRPTEWSDGSMWITILDKCSATSQRSSIATLMAYLGFWRWYADQIQLLQKGHSQTPGAGTSQMSHKMAAGKALDMIQQQSGYSGSKWIGNAGPVSLGDQDADLQTQDKTKRHHERSRLKTILARSKILAEDIVHELGLGSILHPDIWSYIKMSKQGRRERIEHMKSNPNYLLLLAILSSQLESISNGRGLRTDQFLDELEEHRLITGQQKKQLIRENESELDPVSKSRLKKAVKTLNRDATSVVFGKRKWEEDSTIDETLEVTRSSFEKFRAGRRLNSWMVMVGMQTLDRPVWVRLYFSILLDSRKETTQPNPLPVLTNTINKAQGAKDEGLVHIIPLKHGRARFTLLEINERDRMIYHYDSMARQNGTDTNASSII